MRFSRGSGRRGASSDLDTKYARVAGEPWSGGLSTAPILGALGSCVRWMEVFDSEGNSLGFIPIYDSII